MTLTDIVAAGNHWSHRMALLQPLNIVELGTGQGAASAIIMANLRPDAQFTTINYADGHVFGAQLQPYFGDPRLLFLAADTINPKTLDMVPDYIDVLFIDTTHEAWHAALELTLWQKKLRHNAIVVVDDLDQHDMMAFWDSVPYEKCLDIYQGVFRYDSTPYTGSFPKPDKSTYVKGTHA